MRELGNGPIAVQRGSTRACQREEKADLERPNNGSRTGDRGPASSRATEIRPSSAREHKHHLRRRPRRTSSCARTGRSYDRPVRRSSRQDSSIPAGPIESRSHGGGFSSSTWHSAHANRPFEILLEEKLLAPASPISVKSEVNPPGLESTPALPSSSGAAGQFQPEQPWDGGSSGGFHPLYRIDGPRSIRLARKVQF